MGQGAGALKAEAFRLIAQIDPAEFRGGRAALTTELLHAPLDASLLGPASRYIRETREALLAYDAEELAALRFSIILTARLEASEDESPEQRAELRADLELLRRHYGDKIDERTVVAPLEMKPLVIVRQAEVGREEGGETGCGI